MKSNSGASTLKQTPRIASAELIGPEQHSDQKTIALSQSVFMRAVLSETATATSPVDLLTLRKDDLVEILHQWPEVMVELTVEAERLYLEVKVRMKYV